MPRLSLYLSSFLQLLLLPENIKRPIYLDTKTTAAKTLFTSVALLNRVGQISNKKSTSEGDQIGSKNVKRSFGDELEVSELVFSRNAPKHYQYSMRSQFCGGIVWRFLKTSPPMEETLNSALEACQMSLEDRQG